MSKDKKTPPSQDTKSQSKSEEQKKREAKAKKRAQEQDNQVSKLRAKEFRRSGSERGFNKDLVADKSWHTASGLAHTEHQQGEGDKESEALPVSDTEPSQTSVSPSEKMAKTRAEVSDDTGENEKPQSTQDHRGGHHLVATSSHTDSGTYTPLSNISGVSKIIAPALLPVFKHLAEHHTNDIDALSHPTTTTSSQNHSEQLESTSHPLHIVSSMRHAALKEDTSQDQVAGQLTTSGDGSQSVIWSVENKGGHYGELTLDSHSGEWVYHLDNQLASTNALAEGEHKTEQFVVVATDNHGKTLSTVISVEVDGSNDRPVISGVHSGSVNEHGVIDEAVGQLIAVDPDHGDSVTWGVVQPKGSFGELYIDASSGEWRYQLDNQATSTVALTDGQVGTETFLVTATDSSGVPVEQIVTISVHGTNQSATVSGIFTGSVTEDLVSPSGHLETQGQLSVIDPDSGENAFTPEILTGKYGQIDIDAHGHWVYTADNNNATIQSLKGGEQLKEVLYVHTIDGTSQAISITVSGTNDKAVISGVTTGTLKEDVITDYQGKLDVIDTDSGQSGFVEQPNTQGQYGAFTIDSDGFWHYTLNNQDSKVQGLNEGQQLTETFTVKTLDGTSREIQVNIQGTDETSSSSHTTTTQQVGGGNPTTQAPNTVTPTFAHGSNVPHQPDSSVNHAPIISSTSTVDVDEDGKIAQGQIHASDADTGDHLHFSAGQVDGFTLNADGTWSFDPSHNAYQHLAQGQTETLTIPVTVTDNAGATDTQNLTITVSGTNDGAVISGAGAQLKEDSTVSASGELQASGQLTVQDVDSGEAAFTPITDVASDSGYGHFSLSADGQWQYHADNNQPAIQQLAAGEPLTDSITATSVDGTPHTISVKIVGTNDAPIVAHSVASQQIDEDSAVQFTLTTDTFGDIDHGDTMTLSTGNLPTWLHFDAATGTFSGTPTNSDVGSTPVTVTATDDHGAQVSTTFDLTVNNVNDAPTLTPIASVSVDEDGQQAYGQLIATDPDAGDTLSYSIANPVSGLTFNPDGSWVFDPTDAAYQSLPAGQSQTLTIPVTVTDKAGATDVQNLVITVNGTNDGAVIFGSGAQLKEDSAVSASGELEANGQLTVQDVDSGEAAFTPITDVTSDLGYGHFSLSADGQWQYHADNNQPAIQQLAAGEPLTDSITVTSVDGTPHTISVTIEGTNDAPIVAHTITSQQIDEDTGFSFTVPSDTFTDIDIDIGDTITLSTGTLPTWLHFDAATGTFSGTPANSDVGSVPISVTATDSQGASVTTQFNLTVNNTNDAPLMTPIASVSVDEDGQKASGQLIATDPDVGDTLSYSIANPVSGLTFNPDGSWVFDPTDAAYQSLPAGQSQTLTIPVTVTDTAGATDVQNLVITVHGTNDGAVISGAGAQLKEDTAVSTSGDLEASGQLTIQDVDSGEASFTPITDVTSDSGYGHFSLSADGQWQYHADNNQPAIQQLAAGEPLTDSIAVTSVDGTSHTISVTIEGTNDAPIVAHSIASQQIDEDSALQFTLPTDTFGDIDHGDTLTLSTGSLPTWLHFDAATGTFSGTPTNSDVGSNQVTVTATDSHGAQVSTTFDLTVNNVNDAPTLTPIASVSVDEDGQQASGQLIATDPDVGDTLSYSIANPVSGLTFNPDGSWVFDPTDAAYQSLPAAQSQTLTIPVTVTDAAGATDVQNLVITVNGTNDGAVISGAGAQLKEDTAVSASGELEANGQLTVQDVDSGEAAFTPITDITSDSGYGHFSLSADGQWQYHADNNQPAIQQLAEGEPLTDSITVTSVDGTSHTISVTIEGSNDAPIVVHSVASQQIDEDNALQFALPTDTFGDIDHGDTLTLSTGSLPTWLHFDASTGTFSGTPTNSDVGSVPISVTATDSQGASVTTQFNLTVNNTNDAPVMTPIASISVDEDGQQATGQLIATDPDVGDTLSYSITNPVSGLTFNPDGSWVFDPTDAAYQSLPAGQSQTLTIPVTVTDAAGATDVQNLVITVNGTNDGARMGGNLLYVLAEDQDAIHGDLTANGHLVVLDVDRGESHIIAQSVTGQYGRFSIDEQGHWTYSADNSNPAIQALGQNGQGEIVERFTVSSADGSASRDVVVRIMGTNDGPVVNHAISGAVADEDTAFSFTVPSDTFTDIDIGDTMTLSTGTLPTWLHFNASTGTFSGTPTNSDVGSTPVTVTATDDHGAQVSTTFDLTVNNVNDAPVMTPIASVSVDEDGQKASGQLIATDPDAGDTLSYSIANPVSGLTFNPDGSWVFDPTDAAYQSLPAGQSQTLTIPVTVTDTAGATDVQDLVITVNGTNDGAVISGAGAQLKEDSAVSASGELEANGQLTVQDVDSGEASFTPITDVTSDSGYGHFSLSTDGQWQYHADNNQPAIQQLAAGEPLTDSITVTSVDGTTHTISVTIEGTNDAPIVAHTITSQQVDEDSAFSFTVPSDTFNDIDIGDTMTLSTGTLPAWLHFDASTGTFSGTPTNSDVGSTQVTVTATDDHGAQISTTFDLTVNNVNDAPTLTPIASVSVDEDGQQASGQLIATDPDVGDTLSYSIANPVSGLTFNPDGSWVFDPTDAAYQSLPAGQSQTLTIPVTVTDTAGATDVQNLVITVNGTNDGARMGGLSQHMVSEDLNVNHGELIANGRLAVLDVDSGESHITAQSVTGQYGRFSIDEQGHWTYSADNSNPAIQALGQNGQGEIVERFTVSSADGSASRDVVVRIMGTNDGPVVNHAISGAVADEDTAFSFTVPSDTFTDIDIGDTMTLSTGNLPIWLHFDASTGTFSGTPTNSDVGSTPVTVTATDDHGAQISTTFDLTVNNVNDAPTLTPIASISVDEDGQKASGQLIATDPDVGDTLSYSIANPVSGLTFNPDGSWVFDPTDAAYQSLPAGQSQTLTIPVTVTDAAGATDVQDLVITVNGTNDGAVISGAGAQLKEDTAVSTSGDLEASGQLTIQDVDSGEAVFTQISNVMGNAGYGHFSLSADGQWQYHADNNQPAIQQLAEGEPLTDSITVTSVDGTTHTISVTIAGTNDAPIVVHTITSQQVDEDSAFSFTVPSDTFNDIDIGDTMTLSTGSLPTWLHFDASTGTFSGTPTNSDVGSNQVTVTATDDHGAQVSTTFDLTVNNVNDAPTLTPIASISVDEDGQQATGQLIATDPDVGDTLIYSIANPVSGLTFNSDGSWVFDPTDAAYQSLPAGQSQTLTIPVTVTDAAGATDVQNLVITVNGTNDGAVISGSGAQLKEDSVVSASGDLQASGKLTIQDVDSGEAAFTPITDVTSDSGYGHFSLSTDGQWQYHADNNQPAIQQLAKGEPLTDSITITSVDGTPHTISVTIEGTNDAPIVVHSVASQQIDEDSALQFTLPNDTFGEIDHGDTLTLSTGSLPTWLHFDASTGTFSGTPTNSDVGSVPISVTATDSQGASVTTQFSLTVNNSNDAPVMTPIGSVKVQEDGKTVQGQIHASDVDTGDQLHFSAGHVDGFNLNADGSWSFDPSHSSYQHLSVGQTETRTIPVTVTDNEGATDTQDLTIIVTGTNDVPTLTVHTQGMTTGTLVENDVDNSDTHTFGVSQPSGLFGDLALNPQTGAYVYTQHATVTGMTYQASSQTYSGQDTFEVQVSDNHGGTETKYLTFDVSGTLSAPIAGTTQPTIQTQVLAPPVLSTTVANSHVVTPSLTNAVTLQLDVTSDSGVSDQDHITNDDTPTIVGTTSIPFSAVTISENGVVVANALSDGSGHYQVTLPQLPESTHQLVASAVDPSGSGTGQSSVLDIEIDTTPPPVSITLDPITSDDVLNHSELSSVVSVGGSVGSEVSPGSVVTLDIGGSSYNAVVDTNHRFAVDVPGGVLGANSEIVASVSAEDIAGNKSTVTDTHQYSVDDSASIDIDLLSGDNMLDPTEHHEDLIVSGTVNGVEDGQIVNISLGRQDYHATVVNQQWSTTVDATDISALPGGLNSVVATVVDQAGNSASSTSPLFIPDTTNPVPSMSFLTPPTPTGGGGIGSHISGDLVVPPLLQQLMPTQQGGGWAISDGQGHTMTSLKGQYGTLTIDPDTGHVEYIYSDAPVPGDKTAGGTHWAGQTSSEEHHDLFQIVYHDVHASNVDVKVNLDVTYVHGHSGHNQESTHLVDMTVTSASGVSPAPPASQHDEVGTDIEPVAEFTVLLSDDVTGADYTSQSYSSLHKSLPADDQTRPVDHYLNMVGLTPSEVAPAAETKLDHYLHSSTQLVDDLSDVNLVPNHDADLSDALVHDHDKDLAKAHDKGLEETPDNHDHHSDDDLLNSGLNDMHNQI